MELKLVSVIPPSVNHYIRYRATMKNGKPLATSYCTVEAKKYKSDFAKYIREEVSRQKWTMRPNKYQHFYVDAVFYFPRTNMDSSNYFKVLLDAITDTQLIWLDDNVALERVQAVYYDSDNPRIEITIHKVDYIGVFENASQLEAFSSNCIGCTRYTRNCSIFRQAKQGYIQDEIAAAVCNKFKPRTN